MARKIQLFRVGKVAVYLRGKVWYLCYYEHSQRRRPRVGFDKDVARQLAAQTNAQLEVRALTALRFEPISIAELRERWLHYHEHVLRSSVATAQRYRTASAHLLNFIRQVQPVSQAAHFQVARAEAFSAYRGPFFGLILYTLYTAPPALLLAWLLRYARLPQKVLLPVASLAAVFVSWALCAPPTTAQIFQRHLGCSLPDDIREVKRWNDCWGIDPGYYIRFRASNRSVEGIIAKTPLTRDDPAPPAAVGCSAFRGVTGGSPATYRIHGYGGGGGRWEIGMWNCGMTRIPALCT